MHPNVKHGVLAVFVGCLLLILSGWVYAETPFAQFSVVRQKCSVCHKLDDKGRVEVIEETRKTPEEWKVVVERMIRINGGPIEDRDFDPVIKELSEFLILTPEEMQQVAYLNSDENSQYREIPKDKVEERIFVACKRCHTYGKILSHRKTAAQWKETVEMHLGYYPTVLGQMREMDWVKEANELVPILAERLPYETAACKKWMSEHKDHDLTGTWRVAGYQPGMGNYEGAYSFKPNKAKGKDEYLIQREITYAKGMSLRQSGEGTLYGTYHLRYALAPTPLTGRVEGVFDLDAATMGFKGKWWTVVQDTNAYGDESFFKTGGQARVIDLFPRALKADGKPQSVTLIGVGLPEKLTPADLSCADPKVKATAVTESGPTKVVCTLVAESGAKEGGAVLKVKNAAGEETVTVYNKVDGIKISPELGRARVSCGAAYPPQGVQFVARGITNGPDGKPDTEDDIILDPVDADWWLEEQKTRENDDDLKYLNTSIMNGLYTPITTYGPIAERVQHREGIGLIAVGASYKGTGQELKGRSLLAVTVPDFVTHIK